MATFMLTASSQVKSANTESDIANHSGKKNRAKFAHKNKLIDPKRSHLNVEFDVHSRTELLEAHYAKRLENRKKNNRSKNRAWNSLDDFLETFEGKKVRKDSKNERWATLSQVTYVGDKNVMKDIWMTFSNAGVPKEDIRAAYSAGYEQYIEKHNKAFPTLPIYHSDVHFDEETPHGHDAIVVMGHTEKGLASDAFNNALGELYGYHDNKMAGKKANVERYREENDALAYESITGAFQRLAQERGIEMDFEFIRTGQDSSVNVETYKREMDLNNRQLELDEQEKELSGRKAELEERISEVEEREAAVAKREADLTGAEARLRKRDAERDAEQAEFTAKRNELLIAEWNKGFNKGVIDGIETMRDIVKTGANENFLKEAPSETIRRAMYIRAKYTDEAGQVVTRTPYQKYQIAARIVKKEADEAAKSATKSVSVTPAKPATSLDVER